MTTERKTVLLRIDLTTTPDVDHFALVDTLRFHLGLGSLTSTDLDYSAVTILNAALGAEPVTVEHATWCERCGVAYDTSPRRLPTCECAGEPPSSEHDLAYDAWLTRVRRLEVDGGPGIRLGGDTARHSGSGIPPAAPVRHRAQRIAAGRYVYRGRWIVRTTWEGDGPAGGTIVRWELRHRGRVRRGLSRRHPVRRQHPARSKADVDRELDQ